MKLARDSALLIAVPAVFLAAGAWWIVTGGVASGGDSGELRFTLPNRDDVPNLDCPRWPTTLGADATPDETGAPLCGAGADTIAESRPADKNAELARATWSGKVLARDGTPIEGATIVVRGHRNRKLGDDTLLDMELETILSGKDGELAFEMKPGWIYELEIKAPGYGLDKFFLQNQLSRDLVLDRASDLDGVVIDRSTGLPLSGATVIFENGYEHYEALTDPYGRYRFDGVGARAAHVSVVDNRYRATGQPIDFLHPGESSSLNVYLDQGSHLGGQVVAAGSQLPVPNIEVTLMDRFTHQVVSTGFTDAMGRFSFWSLSPFRDYLVSAWGQGYYSNLPAQTFSGNQSITVTVTPTWGLAIKVKADGIPVAGANVFLSRQDGLPMAEGPNSLQAWSNAQGMIAFGGLSRDLAYRVVIDHEGHATMAYTGLVASIAEDQTILVSLQPARTLYGYVVDSLGNPVAGATIRAQRAPGDPFPAPALFVMADGNGAFTFDSLAEGTVSLVTFKAGFDNAHLIVEIPVDSEAPTVELVLEPIQNFMMPGAAQSGGGPGSLVPK